jgi:hypothetical protein
MHPPEHWHRQAQETRQLAAMVSLPSDKLSLLKMAEDYDRQAKAAEEEGSREQEAPGPRRCHGSYGLSASRLIEVPPGRD